MMMPFKVIEKKIVTQKEVKDNFALTKTQLSYYFMPKVVKEHFKECSFSAVLGDDIYAEFFTIKDIVKTMAKKDLPLREKTVKKTDYKILTFLEYKKLDLQLSKKTSTKQKTKKI